MRATLVVFTTLACATTTRSEDLPTEGTFRGYYHVNAAGVGRFSFFLIPAALKERFAPYDAKYIEVQVLKGRQPMNPGPAIADEVGTITIVPQALRAELRIVSPGACGADTIDVIAVITNGGTETMTIDANNTFLDVLSAPDGEPARRNPWYEIGYSAAQLAFGANARGPEMPGGASPTMMLHHWGGIPLEPGQAAPLLWVGARLATGEHELHVILGDPLKRDEHPEAWLPVRAPVPATSTPPASWRVDARVRREDEWFHVYGRVRPIDDKPRLLLLRSEADALQLAGQVRMIMTDGQQIAAEFESDTRQASDAWRQQPVGAEGAKWHARVCSPNHFSTAIVDRIEFWLPTDAGVVPLVLGRDLGLPLALTPPVWGETVNGAHLRIAMPRTRWNRGEQLRFYYEIESAQPGRRILRAERRGDLKSSQALVDGAAVDIAAGGPATGFTYALPQQGVTKLTYGLSLSPGRHTLVFTVTGDGGTYTNVRGEKIPRFEGTLVSNAVEFQIAE